MNCDSVVRRWISINELTVAAHSSRSLQGNKSFVYAGEETKRYCQQVESYFKTLNSRYYL